MSKLSLFKKEWIDMVFEGRNKKYGAYQLRSENPKTTTKAVIIGVLLFSAAIAAPVLIKMGGLADAAEEEVEVVEMIEIEEPIEEPVEIPKPPEIKQVTAPKSIVDEVKFKPLVAVKKEEVPEIPPNNKDFETADPGKKTQEGDPDQGKVNIDVETGTANKDQEVTEDPNAIYNSAGLQVQPDFPGGVAAFLKGVHKNFNTPELDRDLEVRVIVSFVVEKDGSITNVKAARDPGYGLGKEAERAVKAIKQKWSPGIQNGKAVRSTFTLPIKVSIKSS